MKRFALVGSIALAIAVTASFFLGTLWVRHEGSGWVMWEKTTESSHSWPPVESWKVLHSYDSLAKCRVMADNMAVAIAEHRKNRHPKERWELRGKKGGILVKLSADGNVESTEEHVCFPGTLDPRPRFKE